MSKPDIIVEGIGKRYRIGLREQQHTTFREAIVAAMKSPLRRFQRLREQTNGDDTIWALKDVNFEVQPGEVVGIIGRNGAGKTTLLKILSRITEPTEGVTRLRGRVASLLEVGTGFHPELTGRENIYLNGAILGMNNREITRKFDEIVAFSEIEKFLDTPVKRYSSGMYVRLAFAVAAHLEPEILIVDEVLAVGDAAFQKKCLGKMREIGSSSQRTVLFVSHNMSAVQSLCSRALVLESGTQIFDGTASEATTTYLSRFQETASQGKDSRTRFQDRTNKYTPGHLFIRDATLLDSNHAPCAAIPMGASFSIAIEVADLDGFRNAQVGFVLKSQAGDWLCNQNTGMNPPAASMSTERARRFVFTANNIPLVANSYLVDVSVAQKSVGRIDYVERALEFDVVQADVYGSGYSPGRTDGIFFLDGHWTVERPNDRLGESSSHEVRNVRRR